MSYSQALFNVIAIAAILYSIFCLVRTDRRTRKHRRMATPHHSARRNGTQAVP